MQKVARIKVNIITGDILSNHNATHVPTGKFIAIVNVLEDIGKKMGFSSFKRFDTPISDIKVTSKGNIRIIQVYRKRR